MVEEKIQLMVEIKKKSCPVVEQKMEGILRGIRNINIYNKAKVKIVRMFEKSSEAETESTNLPTLF